MTNMTLTWGADFIPLHLPCMSISPKYITHICPSLHGLPTHYIHLSVHHLALSISLLPISHFLCIFPYLPFFCPSPISLSISPFSIHLTTCPVLFPSPIFLTISFCLSVSISIVCANPHFLYKGRVTSIQKKVQLIGWRQNLNLYGPICSS